MGRFSLSLSLSLSLGADASALTTALAPLSVTPVGVELTVERAHRERVCGVSGCNDQRVIDSETRWIDTSRIDLQYVDVIIGDSFIELRTDDLPVQDSYSYDRYYGSATFEFIVPDDLGPTLPIVARRTQTVPRSWSFYPLGTPRATVSSALLGQSTVMMFDNHLVGFTTDSLPSVGYAGDTIRYSFFFDIRSGGNWQGDQVLRLEALRLIAIPESEAGLLLAGGVLGLSLFSRGSQRRRARAAS